MSRIFTFSMAVLFCSASLLAQYNVTFSGGYNIQPNTNATLVQLGEDNNTKVPIGFDFTFFGNTYDSLWMDFHGYVTFIQEPGWFCCGGESIPNTNLPNNYIAACWTDPSPSYDDGNGFFYNEYYYETTGTAPNRIMHITYEFNENCGSAYYYGQIKLFEGSNKIEIHTSEWNYYEDNCNNATQGIENLDGTVGHFYFDRNATQNWQSFGDIVTFTVASDYDLAVPFSSTSNVCEGNNTVGVWVQNLGTEVVDSFDIAWEWDNVFQDSQRIYATVYPQNYYGVTLGNKTFGPLGDQHTLKAWTFNPHGQSDANTSNDTLQNTVIKSSLHGTFTIGGSSPDYATFNDALADLYAYGACDTVIFNVRPGNYNEQLNFIQYFPSTYTVFQAENGDSSSVVLNQNTGNVITLNNNFNLFFKNLTIKQNTAQWDHVIKINNYCINVGFEHCHIEASVNSGFPVISFTNHAGIVNIKDNTIKNGNSGIYMSSYTGNVRDNIVIENNKIIDFNYVGIQTQNTIGMVIKNNYIFTNKYNNPDGIYSVEDESVSIINNIVSITNSAFHGINVESNNGTSRIFNNMVSINNFGVQSIGIGVRDLSGNAHFKVANNSVNIYGPYPNVASNAFLCFSGHCDSLVNNAFINGSNGRAYTMYQNASLLVDHNLLYSSGTNLALIDNTSYNTIAALNGIGKEMHGKNFNPTFFSDIDLHTKDVRLNNIGLPHPEVLTDIDHQNRSNSAPDIGADEFTPPTHDLATTDILPHMKFKYGSQSIKAIVQNLGTDTIDNVTIKWSVNNVAQTDFVYSGSIASTEKDTISIGSFLFNHSTPYVIKAFVHMPNGVMDQYIINDTLTTDTLYAAISDAWTVGNTGNFSTFASALNAVKLGGVVDSVVYQIESGIYHQQVQIDHHANFSCYAPVIFEPLSGTTNSVIIDNVAVNGYPLVLNGGDGFTFKKIAFRSQTTSYPRCVSLGDGAHCNTFENCTFESIGNAEALVYSPSSADRNNKFYSCTFANGYTGLNMASGDDSLQVVNCNFNNQSQYGMYLSGFIHKGFIHNNNINLSTTASNHFKHGIFIDPWSTPQSGNSLRITNNKIVVSSDFAAAGIRLRGISTNTILANNFITCNGPNSFGVWLEGSVSNMQVVHNSIVNGGNNSYSIFCNELGTNVSIKNNVLYSKFSGSNKTIIGFSNHSNSFISDHNDLYMTSGNTAHINSTTYSTLANWQSTNHDLNSISEDPVFDSDTDLHTTSAFLNDLGSPVSGVNTDIDNQTRSSTTPDIGADEFTPVNNDVGILSILGPKQPFPVGNNYIYIKFQNNGIDTLTSMQVNWSINGLAQSPYVWTGVLPSGSTYDSLDIGQYNFPSFTNHTLKIWVSQPNGNVDELHSNDTLYKHNLYPALQGTYTIGGINPDFIDFKTATQELKNGGLLADVIMNIRSGNYSDSISLNPYFGSSCSNNVIFQSESGNRDDVVISNLGYDKTTVRFNGADGIVFKNLTLKSVNPAFISVIEINGGSHCNRIENCLIETLQCGNIGEAGTVVLSKSSPSTQDTSNVIIGNTIKNGTFGVFLINGKNNVIDQNIFVDNYQNSIRLQGESKFTIKGNDISQTQYSNIAFYAVEVYWFGGGGTISHNNIISDKLRYGIYMYEGNGTATIPINIYNNFISNITTYASQADGINISSCSYVNLYNNSVSLSSSYYGFGLALNSVTNLKVKNNISLSSGSHYSSHYANNTNQEINYNNYFHQQSNPANLIAGYTSLNAWQTATNQDTNSLNENPFFLANNDLHTHAVLLNGKGTTLPLVIGDIDGETRQSPPDIGADEYEPLPSDDAGVFMYVGPKVPFASGNQQVKIALKNFGGNILDTVNIRWVVNGMEQPVVHWNGNLASGACDTVTLGVYNFAPYSAHQFIAWTELPNAVLDSFDYNDTLTLNDIYPALNGTYTVGGFLPDFNTFAQIQNAIHYGGTLGNVIFAIRDGIYNTGVLIDPYPKTNTSHTITFKAEDNNSDGVVLNRVGTAIFHLQNVKNIHFNNLEMNHAGGHAVKLSSGASIVSIDSCSISGNTYNGPYADNYSSLASIYSEGTNEDSIQITKSSFHNASYGIYLYSGWGNLEKDNVIDGNTFTGRYYNVINLGHQQNAFVKNNLLDVTVTTRVLELWDMHSMNFSNNKINSHSTVSYNDAVYMWNIWGTSTNKTIFSNNYIYSDGNNFNSLLAFDNFGNMDFINNTVRSNIITSNSRAIRFNTYDFESFNFKNNILFSYNKNRCLDYQGTNGSVTFSHNNFYNQGGSLVQWNGVFYSSISSLATATINHANSHQLQPLFIDENNYTPQQPLFNNNGTPTPSVTIDIEGNTRNNPPDIGCKEFTPPLHDVGIIAMISPYDTCALSSTQMMKVRVQNFGSANETNFTVSYKVNNNAWVNETISSTILTGQTLDYTFTNVANLSAYGNYTIQLKTSLPSDLAHDNDSIQVTVENITPLSSPVSNMIPLDNTANLESTVSFSWLPAPNATRYDIHLWKTTQSRNAIPDKTNVTIINTSIGGLDFGTSYYWQVNAKNECGQNMWSDTNQFTVRFLPDLVVDSVQIPSNAYTNQTIGIDWIINNIGQGSTNNVSWVDKIYLSADATFNPSFDIYLGGFLNLTALNDTASYAQMQTVILPNNIVGNYYILLVADSENSILETNNNNNYKVSNNQINIQLSPTPDLRVTMVTNQSNAFSGQNTIVNYTVKNTGTAATSQSVWYDQIIFGTDSLNAIGIVLSTVEHAGVLMIDSIYQMQKSVNIPQNIFGKYFFHVKTDYTNLVYEYSAESNNVKVGNGLNVILAPTADLKPLNTTLPDTLHNNQCLTFGYSIINDGIGSTFTSTNYWLDKFYVSKSPIFNQNFNYLLAQNYIGTTINSLQSYTNNPNVCIDNNLTENYYGYIETDASDNINEYNGENNNVLKLTQQFYVANPDLEINDIIQNPGVIAGNNLTTSLKLKNIGLGHLLSRSYKIKVFISSNSVYNANTSTLLNTSTYNNTIHKHDSISIANSIYIPLQYQGVYYLHTLVDGDNQILESNESNNLYTKTVTIYQGSTPDLTVDSIILPDSTQAGSNLLVDFNLKNSGIADALPIWNDKIYISFDSIWNATNAVLLTTIPNTTLLSAGGAKNIQRQVLLPETLAENIYYLYIIIDTENQIYESTNEGNNIKRSSPVFVKKFPPSDLVMSKISFIPDTIWSGNMYSIHKHYTRNTTSLKSYTVSDKIYLSTDSIFQTSDLEIEENSENLSSLILMDTISKSNNVSIPISTNGDYYIIVKTDVNQINNDTNWVNNQNLLRSSNGMPKKIHINLSPIPDIILQSYSINNSLITGYASKLNFTIKNQGNAIASNTNYKIYLSLDPIIDITDLSLNTGSIPSLNTNQSHIDSSVFYIPSAYTGNYYLIVHIEANDYFYEGIGEINNINPISITSINPPPSDIIVENIYSPNDTFQMGLNYNINYILKNNGSSSTIGLIDDIVYLSQDTVWDIQDQLIGKVAAYGAILQNGLLSRVANCIITGVLPGEYYLIVRTDVKQFIHESNENNNDGYSVTKVFVAFESLPIEIPKTPTITNGGVKYYELDIPASLFGETVKISVSSDTSAVINEIYASRNNIPSRANHDHSARVPLERVQQLIINEAIPGKYYIAIYGNSFTSTSQVDTVLAKVVDFEFISVFPKKGVANTQVTLKIKGTKFLNTPVWRMRRYEPYEYVPSQNVLIQNANTAYVTYNLDSVKVDTYNVEAIKADSTMAYLYKSFEIVEEGITDLQLDVEGPGTVSRRQSPVQITLRYINAGNTDIINPKVLVSAPYNNGLANTLEELLSNNTSYQLIVDLKEANVPLNLLRPNASGIIEIYAWGLPRPSYTVQLIKE